MKRVCQRSREVLKCEIRRGTNVRKRYSKLCCCWDGSSVVYSTQYVYSTGGTHVVRSTAVPLSKQKNQILMIFVLSTIYCFFAVFVFSLYTEGMYCTYICIVDTYMYIHVHEGQDSLPVVADVERFEFQYFSGKFLDQWRKSDLSTSATS